jgi:hypothetical protein
MLMILRGVGFLTGVFLRCSTPAWVQSRMLKHAGCRFYVLHVFGTFLPEAPKLRFFPAAAFSLGRTLAAGAEQRLFVPG